MEREKKNKDDKIVEFLNSAMHKGIHPLELPYYMSFCLLLLLSKFTQSFASCTEMNVNISEMGNQYYSSGGWLLSQKACEETLDFGRYVQKSCICYKKFMKIRVMLKHLVFSWNAGTLRICQSYVDHGTKPLIALI